jgi:hypothetical protein
MGPRPFAWNRTAERLCAVLLEDSRELGWRVDAAMDPFNWQDHCVHGALVRTGQAGDLVGVSDM